MSKITEAFERIAALEEMVGIGHNGGPTFGPTATTAQADKARRLAA